MKIGDRVEIIGNKDIPHGETKSHIGRCGVIVDIPDDGFGQIVEVKIEYGGLDTDITLLAWIEEIKLLKTEEKQ